MTLARLSFCGFIAIAHTQWISLTRTPLLIEINRKLLALARPLIILFGIFKAERGLPVEVMQ
jgi:hypothetical protein